MEKSRKHGYKNWLEAMERDCPVGTAPHNPRVIYHPEEGFAVKSSLSPLPDGYVVAFPNYEPWGTSETEYRRAVAYIREQ